MRPLFCVTLLLLVLSVATSAAAQPKAYTVASGRSQVMFEATYPLANFTGTTEKVTGEFRINPDNVTQGITGNVTINPGDLKTGLEGRDTDLKKALEAEPYREIRFKVQDVRASFPSLAERADITLQIGGMMLIRGVERVMTWTGRARIEDGMIWVRGETELRMTDFGITPPRKLFLAVGDSVRVSFDLRLALKE